MTDTPPKRGRGRPRKDALDEATKKDVTVRAAAADDLAAVAAEFGRKNHAPCIYNRNISDEQHLAILTRVAMGDRLVDICHELGLSTALVRKKWYDSEEWGARAREARMIAADQKFDEMLDVARDPTLDTARANLIVNTLEKIAKAHNRGAYGDKVQHDVRSVNITLDPNDRGLT